jgi:hypothetical protein
VMMGIMGHVCNSSYLGLIWRIPVQSQPRQKVNETSFNQ